MQQYERRERIGRGAMGDVYAGFDSSLDRPVAIKVIKEVLAEEEVFVERFIQEAKTCAKLKNPNIVDVYAVGSGPDGLPCMVMELLEGQTLQKRISAGKLPEKEATQTAIAVLGALDCAHGRAVVHRDIKPGNIFICHDGTVKVLDFGIAKAHDANTRTRTGVQIGTPQYMSPEQYSSGDIDGRSDIYSLGVVLYEMLAGTVPFQADSDPQAMYQHLNSLPPLLPSSVSSKLASVVYKALKKNPKDRYSTAEEMLQALQSTLLDGKLPPPPPPRGSKTGLMEELRAISFSKVFPVAAWVKAAPWKRGNTPGFIFLALFPLLMFAYTRGMMENHSIVAFRHAGWLFAIYIGALILIVFKEFMQPENTGKLVAQVLLFTLVAGLLTQFITGQLIVRPGQDMATSAIPILITLLIKVVIEEVVKALPLILLVWRKQLDYSPKTYAFLGAVSGIAFATAWALHNVYDRSLEWEDVRPELATYINIMILGALREAALAGIAGYFIGMARGSKQSPRALIGVGLAISVVMKVIFEFCARSRTESLQWIAELVIIGIIWVFISYVSGGDEVSETSVTHQAAL